MREVNKKSSSDLSSREKISKTLKEKWQDPAFREKMTKAMNDNKNITSPSESQKAKISAAMKKKWQDKEYRAKAMKGMVEYRESLPVKAEKTKIVSQAAATIKLDDVFAVAPIQKATKKKKMKGSITVSSTNANSVKQTGKTKKKRKKKSVVKLAETTDMLQNSDLTDIKNGKAKEKKDDGDISRMREERRDLYDLLYGDEPEVEIVSEEEDFSPVLPDPLSDSSNSAIAFFGDDNDLLDDENLDDFDPYGLDDR